MVVHHLIISWIQVGGLVASLFGILYIWMGLVPTSKSFWRPFLPASAVCIAAVLVISIMIHSAVPGSSTSLWQIYGVLTFPWALVFYRIVDDLQRGVTSRLNPIGGVAVFAFAGIVEVGLLVLYHDSLSNALLAGIVWTCTSVLLGEATIALRFFTPTRRIHIGGVLSVLGMLTLFVPAVLDVAGVTIR